MAGEAEKRSAAGARETQRAFSLTRLIEEVPGQFGFWLVALLVGVASGYMALGFRLAIEALQTFFYGVDDKAISTYAADLNPALVLLLPVAGGLVVGLILQLGSPGCRALSVSDVIAASALRDGRTDKRAGLASAAASLVTLSTGGSTGREGPVVHLASVIAGWVSDRLGARGVVARDILGCAVAAGVSASFNAPIAGALFALEVVLRHYAVHAFGPIVLASVAGAVVSRLHLGEFTEFILPPETLEFYEEIPAFMLLGLVSGFAAVVMMRALFLAENLADAVQARTGLPSMLRPAVAGLFLGIIALGFPHVIGVGYETTRNALTIGLDFWTCVIFAVVKVVAVAITYAGRMGGGVFSPAMMLGALTGLGFGYVATGFFPEVSGSQGLYAMAGMGAVAAAVLGAPISTTLIVFELTGDYQAAIAVMISVSLASLVANRFVWTSFFLTQLRRSGINLAEGPESYLPATIPVRDIMRLRGAKNFGASDSACLELARQGAALTRSDSLAEATPLFERMPGAPLPVVEIGKDGEMELIGALHETDALKAINRALVETHKEEHG